MQSRVEVGGADQNIVHTAEPEPGSVALDGNRLVDQNLNALGAQRAGHAIGIGETVVVPHHRPRSVRRLHLAQQLGARFRGGRARSRIAEQRRGNEIPGQHDHFGVQSVDHGDRRPQRMDGKIRVVMEVAKQRDGEAFQPRRPAPESNFLAHDSRTVRLEQRGVGGQGGYAGGGCEADKSPPCHFGRGKKRQSVSGPYTTELRGARSALSACALSMPFSASPESASSRYDRSSAPEVRESVRRRTPLAVQCGGWPKYPARTDLPAEHWTCQTARSPEPN